MLAAIKRVFWAVFYRLQGKQGQSADEKAKEDARSRLADRASEQAREAVTAFNLEHAEVSRTARRTISLIVRANARL